LLYPPFPLSFSVVKVSKKLSLVVVTGGIVVVVTIGPVVVGTSVVVVTGGIVVVVTIGPVVVGTSVVVGTGGIVVVGNSVVCSCVVGSGEGVVGASVDVVGPAHVPVVEMWPFAQQVASFVL